MSEPVLVLYKADTCGHCKNLTSLWPTITDAIKLVFPKLRYFIFSTPEMNGVFDTKIIPKDLIRYARWFPMILLVPGKVWDNAINNLGPNSTALVKDCVQIMNGKWNEDKETFTHEGKYDPRRPEDFVKWLKVAMEDPDFKKESSNKSIQTLFPTLKPIQKPVIPENPKPKENLIVPSPSAPNLNIKDEFNVCNMNIISRP